MDNILFDLANTPITTDDQYDQVIFELTAMHEEAVWIGDSETQNKIQIILNSLLDSIE